MGVSWADASPAEAERLRLAALRRYDVLDTPPEREFDEVAALAADLLQAPVALVSLVDEHRQWSKARVEIDAPGVPRAWAFCDHALRARGECLVVPDAAADPRFADNPLVTVHYPFHPRCGESVSVYRRHSFRGSAMLVVQQRDGTLAQVPEWMCMPEAAGVTTCAVRCLPLRVPRELHLCADHGIASSSAEDGERDVSAQAADAAGPVRRRRPAGAVSAGGGTDPPDAAGGAAPGGGGRGARGRGERR